MFASLSKRQVANGRHSAGREASRSPSWLMLALFFFRSSNRFSGWDRIHFPVSGWESGGSDDSISPVSWLGKSETATAKWKEKRSAYVWLTCALLALGTLRGTAWRLIGRIDQMQLPSSTPFIRIQRMRTQRTLKRCPLTTLTCTAVGQQAAFVFVACFFLDHDCVKHCVLIGSLEFGEI